MAEGVLFNVAGGIIGRLGSLAFQEIGLIWGVQDEFQKLKETVAGFQAVLLDAEQKQANNEVKLWLQSVEDAVYEADDVLDEFNTEAQRRQLVLGNTKLSKKVLLSFSSSNPFGFGLKMGHKLKKINKRLSEAASCRPYDLKDHGEDTQFTMRERVTHSFVPKENIIGRDEDRKAIIELLLYPISTENVSTISIVGHGGLGKTALAQLIFNDEVIRNHFELKIWTCVSNVFVLDIVVKKILQSKNHDEIEQLQNDLRKKVDGKKYLLVLDDVWNENREKWLSLKNLLMGGGEGSRILITTRSKIVATISDTAKPYTLRGLNEEQSWSLFKKMAYKDGKEPKNPTIKAVGKEVARKCQGVPLTIRTIGGMLFAKDDETYLLNFKEKTLSKINQEMAEGALFKVAGGIIERLRSLAFQEIGLIWGIQDEFKKLMETIAGFQAVLLDAEQKQANNEVKLWLQSVEDAVYKADDVLNEFNTEAQQRHMVPGNTDVGVFFL